MEFQKQNPEKYKVFYFEEAKADLGFVLIKKFVWIILYDSYPMVQMKSDGHSLWSIWYRLYLETELNDETIKKIAKHCRFDNLKNV